MFLDDSFDFLLFHSLLSKTAAAAAADAADVVVDAVVDAAVDIDAVDDTSCERRQMKMRLKRDEPTNSIDVDAAVDDASCHFLSETGEGKDENESLEMMLLLSFEDRNGMGRNRDEPRERERECDTKL